MRHLIPWTGNGGRAACGQGLTRNPRPYPPRRRPGCWSWTTTRSGATAPPGTWTEAGFTVAGTAGSGAQALRIAAAVRPDVVLLDLNLPDLPAAEVIRGLLAAVPSARVLMLSASGERQDVLDAVTAGALGYLLKSAQIDELVAAVSAAATGQPVFTPGLAGLVLGEYRRMAGAAGRRHIRPARRAGHARSGRSSRG